MYRNRTLEKFIKKAGRQFPVVMLTGPRQVGKTTLLQHLTGKKRRYVTLDDPLAAALAKDDPGLFLERYAPPVLIDEIQYAVGLLPYIKMTVDKARKPGMFWLTGSRQFHVMKGISETLAGRVGIIKLLGLSNRELAGKAGNVKPFLPVPSVLDGMLKDSAKLTLKKIYKRIWRGSFPAIALEQEMDRDLFYGSYVQTYLQRDVRDLASVGDESAFLRFLRAAAARTGRILNLSELAREADVAVNTAKRWLSILETSGVVYLLEPYHANITKRLVKRPKLYFLDTGLCAYLTEWSSPETLEAGAMSGAIFETWVVVEILKSYLHNGKQAPLYYYRDRNTKEIDLLVKKDDSFHPIEIKKSATPKKDDVRNFDTLKRAGLNVGPGGLVCMYPDVAPLDKNITTIPVWIL